MSRLPHRPRAGFSLLEMVLALAIGLLILGALYQTLATQVQFAQIGRNAISEADAARSVLTRINDDVVNQLAVLDPRVLPVYDTTTDPSATDPSATDPSATASSSSTTMMSMSTTETTSTSSSVAFNVVRGESNWLTLAVYRVQPGSAVSVDEVTSDLRRVSYWIASSGDRVMGLARKESRQATAAEIDMAPTDLPEQGKQVIAREVKDILFEYYDGTTWQTSWSGSSLGGSSGNIPIGPPAAIAVTIRLRAAGNGNGPDDPGTTYKQVIALPAANNFPGTQVSP